MTNLRTTLLAIIALPLLVAGCAAAAGTPATSPSASTGASLSPVPVTVTTPEQAVARVILAEKRLTGIAAFDPNLIGQASWYKVAPGSGVGAFVVTVRLGWGDCPAGCIDEHTWVYAVAPAGAVSIVSEAGDPVPADAWPSHGSGTRTGIGGTATAGPVCPVERNPPDPSCAPRPVVGAVVVIRRASGAEAARVTTGADGAFFANVPPGVYVVEAQPAKGLMGTPGPQSVTVNEGVTSTIKLDYDTGIR